jgi:uncharacterized membrane protein YwzB
MPSRLARKLAVPFFLLAALGATFAPTLAAAVAPSGNFGLDQTVGEINGGTGGKGTVYDLSATPEQIIGRIIKYLLQFTGIVFFVLMIYAGFTWMTASGDEKKVKEAKGTITAAVIGIVVIAMAYALTSFILTNVSGANDTTTQAPTGGTQ